MEPDEFRKHVKDALEHLYDTAYLQVHPLLPQITDTATASQATRAQKLRGLLKDTIEALRPQQGSPSNSPREAWRSYLALRYRYVQGMNMAQIEHELGISLRQLQRELHKGLDALSELLWDMRRGDVMSGISSMPFTAGELQELRDELNRWELTRQPCQVQALVEDTLSILEPFLDQQGSTIQVDLPADLPPVLVDSTLTRQALFKVARLVAQNAAGPVLLRASQQNQQVDVILQGRVADIPQAAQEWQMAQLLIYQQGGRLTVETLPSGEKIVALSLPYASQTRVLVIDDNQAIHQLFERYLVPRRYEVLHARTGQEALQIATEARPDLITLDVMLPGMDGWQVLRSLVQNPTTKNIPVIVCSVLKEPELAFSLGARAYLKKPVDRLELLETLARLRPLAGPGEAASPPAPGGN